MCCLREPEWSDDENIEGPDLTKEVLKVLEPDAGKLARPVLRGGSHGNVTFLPDNLIAEETPARHVQYRYDALGRLTSLTCNGQVTHYLYDSFNRRLKKSSDQGEERYLYVDQNEIAQVDSYGKIVQLRVLGRGKGAEIGSAVALELDGKVYIPIHDHSGHVSILVDPGNQTLAEGYTYTAFGEELRYGPGTTNPWHFSSKRYDPESGWIYFGRRYYDPITGRWTTPDPIGFTDGPNLYAYVKNNPLTHFDLYGLLLCTDFHSPETLCNRRPISSPLNSTRIFGALQAFGGLTEAGLGGGLSMASQGVFVPLGMAMIAHGVDHYTAGMSTLFSGKPQSTLSAQGLQKCGLSAGRSHAVDNTLSMVATLGANAYLQTLRQATPLLGKNASAITYQKASLSPAVDEVKATKQISSDVIPNALGKRRATEYVNLASEARTNHILYGDATGGGHLYPGLEGKSMFPKSWSGDKIMHHISDIATDPKIVWDQISGRIGALTTRSGLPVRYQAIGEREGVNIKVILEAVGEGIITGYPGP